MSSIRPEDPRGPQHFTSTVSEFLASPLLLEAVRTHQTREREYSLNKPIDQALAEMIARVGSEYLQSVYSAKLADPDHFQLSPTIKNDLMQGVAAVTFGVSYLAFRKFLTVDPNNPKRDTVFQSGHLLERFDGELRHTPLSHKTAFPAKGRQPLPTEVINAADWNQMIDVAQQFGFAAFMNGHKWVKLPQVMEQLTKTLGIEQEVPKIVEMFQSTLVQIESAQERYTRLQSILPKLPEPADQITAPTRPTIPARRGDPQAMDIFKLMESDSFLMGKIEEL